MDRTVQPPPPSPPPQQQQQQQEDTDAAVATSSEIESTNIIPLIEEPTPPQPLEPQQQQQQQHVNEEDHDEDDDVLSNKNDHHNHETQLLDERRRRVHEAAALAAAATKRARRRHEAAALATKQARQRLGAKAATIATKQQHQQQPPDMNVTTINRRPPPFDEDFMINLMDTGALRPEITEDTPVLVVPTDMTESQLAAVRPIQKQTRRRKKTTSRAASSTYEEAKLPEEAEERLFSVPLASFHAAPSIGDNEGDDGNHRNIIRSAADDVRPGAVRVLGIDPSQGALFDEGDDREGHEEEEDLDNAARIQGGVVAEVVDVDQLDNEYRSRHGVVEAEKVVILSKARRRWIALGVVVVIAVIALTGVLVYLSKKSSPSSPQVPTTAPTLSRRPTAAPTLSPTLSRRPTAAPSISRLNVFRSVLLNHNVSTKNSLSSTTTDQYQSLDWLANQDMLDVSASAETIIHRYVLALFYYATKGNTWGSKLGFLSNSSICEWHDESSGYGVICNTTLNISRGFSMIMFDNRLIGSIPTELGKISSLSSLSFYRNQLVGLIPTELGKLSSLNSLSLANNQLVGFIPTELGKLSNLNSLSLANNQLSGWIPTELGKLSSLNYLDLFDNQLTGTIRNDSLLCNRSFPLERFVTDCDVNCSCCTSCT